MSKYPKAKASPSHEFDVDTIITNKIIDALEQGVIPWRQPWHGADMIPKNLLTGQEYTGSNIFLLMAACYDNPWWVTFNQAKELGGTVRKGEHGSTIVRWLIKEVEPKGKGEATPDAAGKTPNTRKLYFPKVYTVFNVRQCDGLNVPALPPALEFHPVIAAEQVIAGYADKPRIEHGYNLAAYSPSADLIKMPHPTAFESAETYYKTLLHEVVHSTGAPNRLNRQIQNAFGTEAYAREEFVAELGAAVLCARCGINTEKLDQESVAYCQSWGQRLKADKTLFLTLSKQAIEGARYIAKPAAEPEAVSGPALTPEVAPALVMKHDDLPAPVFSIPDRLTALGIARLLGTQPSLKAIQQQLNAPAAFAGLHPEQAAQVLNGYERLRLELMVDYQAKGNYLPGVPRVVFEPSRPIDPARIIENAGAYLGRSLARYEIANLSEFMQDRPQVRAAVEAKLGFSYIWQQAQPKTAAPDALHCNAKQLLDLDAGVMAPKEVARIFGRESVSPQVWRALSLHQRVEPRAAGEVYDTMVAAVGLEQVHEALVRAGYDGLTSTERQLTAGQHWGDVQPAGLPATARRWEAFAMTSASPRLVLPLTEEAVNQGVTLTTLGVPPQLAEQTINNLRPKLAGVPIDLFATSEELLPFYPKELHHSLMNAEAFYDPALGRVIVIAGNVEVRNGEQPAQAVTRACLHEAVVHYGLRKVLGEAADSLFTRVRAQAAAGFDGAQSSNWNTPERAAFKAVVNSPNYQHLSPAQQGEEILARIQESHQAKALGAWQRGVGACRLALGVMFPDLKVTAKDVDYLLWCGRQTASQALTPAEQAKRTTRFLQTESAWVDKKVAAELGIKPSSSAPQSVLAEHLRPSWTQEWSKTHPEVPQPKFTLPACPLPAEEPPSRTSTYQTSTSYEQVSTYEPELAVSRGPDL